ncbi:MAG: PIN domain-containing protein [Candidatus Dormibacteria bacterium]
MSADSPREFLDTNVLVYAHDTTAGDRRAGAIELLERLAHDRRVALSVQVLQEFFVTVTRKLPNPIAITEAQAIVADLSTLPTHAPSGNDVLAAIDLHRAHGISFWDAMVIRSAAQLDCAVLWSEDLAAGQQYGSVEVRNPFLD